VLILEGTLSEIYDPATHTTSRGAMMTRNRNQFTATVLANGRILIVGGQAWDPETQANTTLDTAEIYDPETGLFTELPSRLNEPRHAHGATLLIGGRVLITGGLGPQPVAGQPFPFLNSAEIFDPETGRFTRVGQMLNARYRHTATLLRDGRVLIVGGWTEGPRVGAEIFDPTFETFTAAIGQPTVERVHHTATLLDDGRVLIVGGQKWSSSDILRSTDYFDPVMERFSAGPSLGAPRAGHTTTVLADGSLLVAGGTQTPDWQETAALELYPAGSEVGFFSPGSLAVSRRDHAALAIGTKVLFVGGGGNTQLARHALEVYD
jgi:hypothetical protein